MNIDWIHFTPLASFAGGVLIGLSVALLLLFGGRVAGISGIAGGLLRSKRSGDFAWRIAFLLGLMLSPAIYGRLTQLPESHLDAGTAVLIVAGLLVGFGTRLGSGCTSGHGVCGLSRLSPRSLVATGVFMLTGFLTVFAVRHLWV